MHAMPDMHDMHEGEHARPDGREGAVGARADIWSGGSLLYMERRQPSNLPCQTPSCPRP